LFNGRFPGGAEARGGKLIDCQQGGGEAMRGRGHCHKEQQNYQPAIH
jgi:hypothetical protein